VISTDKANVKNISYPFGKNPVSRDVSIDIDVEAGYLIGESWTPAKCDYTVNLYINNLLTNTVVSQSSLSCSLPDTNFFQTPELNHLTIELVDITPYDKDHKGIPMLKICKLCIERVSILLPNLLGGYQQHCEKSAQRDSSVYLEQGWQQLWYFETPIYYFLVKKV